MSTVFSLLVDNTSGVLSRIAGMFSRRGYNIDSLTVGVTADPKYSRMTVVVNGEEQIVEQIEKQLRKQEDVIEIKMLQDNKSVCRELILIKIRANASDRQDVIAISDVFRAKIVDVAQDSLVIELTGNQAKLAAMRSRLRQIGIELVGLNDLKADGLDIPKVVENGNTPLENARLKAKGYYEAFHIPVFSCDSGLYFDNVPDEIQPGVHVRNVNGKRLSDDEMIDYYSGLVKIYGNLVARYKNAICFVMDDTHMYEAMEPSMESEKFILTDKPHSTIRKEGFPLDSISLEINTNKYYYDLPEDKLEQVAVEDGFLEFFKNIYCVCEKDSFIPGEI